MMLDYLQLSKHIPLSFCETFSSTRSSPTVRCFGSSATRLPNGPSSAHGLPVNPTAPAVAIDRGQGGKHSIVAVAVSSHVYYDVVVELELEVVHFGVDVGECEAGSLVVGFMSTAVLAEALGSGDSGEKQQQQRHSVKLNVKPTHQKSFHGECRGW
jgi:hypothetical protein